MRNPHATNLRHHRQQIVPDKRHEAIAQRMVREAAAVMAQWRREDIDCTENDQ